MVIQLGPNLAGFIFDDHKAFLLRQPVLYVCGFPVEAPLGSAD